MLIFFFHDKSCCWKTVKLRNSTFWNVGEKLGFPFSIWGTWGSWAISCLGWYIFWYSQLRKSLFFSFKWRQPEVSTIISFGAMNFLIFFYFFAFLQKSRFFIDPIFRPYVTREKSQDVTQIDPNFYDASFCILLCLRDRKTEREENRKGKRKRKSERDIHPPHTHTQTFTQRERERERERKRIERERERERQRERQWERKRNRK